MVSLIKLIWIRRLITPYETKNINKNLKVCNSIEITIVDISTQLNEVTIVDVRLSAPS